MPIRHYHVTPCHYAIDVYAGQLIYYAAIIATPPIYAHAAFAADVLMLLMLLTLFDIYATPITLMPLRYASATYATPLLPPLRHTLFTLLFFAHYATRLRYTPRCHYDDADTMAIISLPSLLFAGFMPRRARHTRRRHADAAAMLRHAFMI